MSRQSEVQGQSVFSHSLSSRFSRRALLASALLVSAITTQASNADLFKVSDHTLVDLAARYDFGRDSRWRLAVNANNLFDRTFVAQCTGASFCYYGARREVLASLGGRW